MHDKIYNYLYKITNIINGKIYIGVHSTDDMNDGYTGSGKLIRIAIKKYGAENFVKEILQTFDDVKTMYEAESVLVNEEFVSADNTYNLVKGGCGGFCKIQPDGSWVRIKPDLTTPEVKKKISAGLAKRRRDCGEWITSHHHSVAAKNKMRDKISEALTGRKLSIEHRRATSDGLKKYFAEHGSWHVGRHHSEASKAKMRAAQRRRGCNSTKGTCWISNNETQISKMIPKTDKIPDGWVLGQHVWNRGTQRLPTPTKLHKLEEAKNEAIRLYAIYTEHGFKSVASFVRSDVYDSTYPDHAVRRLFYKYIL